MQQGGVARVRQEAARRENATTFGPPMWKDFDAYVSPDGRVHNNARLVGEVDGIYRFEKCLAERGFSLGPVSKDSQSKTPETCTQEEIDYRPGDCWIKMGPWDKCILYNGLSYGWLHSYEFAKRQ